MSILQRRRIVFLVPIVWVLAGMVVSIVLADARPVSKRRPNVVLIMTDDQGYGDLACHGNKVKTPNLDKATPNLDRPYAKRVRLADFHVRPACATTRAALMTGRCPSRVAVWHVIMGRCLLHHQLCTMRTIPPGLVSIPTRRIIDDHAQPW
jgi:hypothetical protein